jgi:hypothetical protein
MLKWDSDERGTFAATPDAHAFRLARAVAKGDRAAFDQELSRREKCNERRPAPLFAIPKG